jgi:prephenate dehydratase
MVAEGDRADAAAVASRRAADVFGLAIAEAEIQDYAANITRFVIVGRSAAPAEEATKTSLVFALKSTPGSLYKALSGFALRDINLTKLESRPMRGRPWEYLFYADIEAPRHSLACARAIVHLSEFAQWVRTLGSYRAFAHAQLNARCARGSMVNAEESVVKVAGSAENLEPGT